MHSGSFAISDPCRYTLPSFLLCHFSFICLKYLHGIFIAISFKWASTLVKMRSMNERMKIDLGQSRKVKRENPNANGDEKGERERQNRTEFGSHKSIHVVTTAAAIATVAASSRSATATKVSALPLILVRKSTLLIHQFNDSAYFSCLMFTHLKYKCVQIGWINRHLTCKTY